MMQKMCGCLLSTMRRKKQNSTSHRYECGTTFHGFKFSHIYIKCAIQLLFKTLAIYRVEKADQLAQLQTDVTQIRANIDNNSGIPLLVTIEKEQFECIMW